MAKIGMEYVVMAKCTEDESGAATYSDGRYIGPSSAFSATANNNEVKDYGDDRAVESDVTLNDFSISVEVNELPLELEAFMLGHAYDSDAKEMQTTTEDIAPYLGVGFIGKSRRNNKTVYRGVWFVKCQFANPNEENATKQESTTFNHSTLEGTAYPLPNHDMSTKKEFDDLDDAKAWLNGLAGIETVGA